MRGIRIATFVLAAISACQLCSYVIGIDPWPERDHSVKLDQAGPPPEVPPPPPLPASPAGSPAIEPDPADVEQGEPVADMIPPAPEYGSPEVEKPVIFTGDVEVLSPAPQSTAAFAGHAGVQTASVAEPRAAVPR
jgi:hypothetical protein